MTGFLPRALPVSVAFLPLPQAKPASPAPYNGKVEGRFYQYSRAFDASLILSPELWQQLDSVGELLTLTRRFGRFDSIQS